MTRITGRLMALAAIVFVAGAGISCGSKSPPETASGSGPPQGDDSAAATGVVAALEDLKIPADSLLQAGQRLADTLPADGYDVAAAAATVGNDIGDTFAFVQDNLAFDPYAGAQRGAAGALMVRAGNAIDRSLLLAAMLEANGHSTRLVQGTLDAGLVEKLMARTREPPVPATEPEMDAAALAAGSGLAEADVRRLIEAADTAAHRARDAISGHVAHQVDSILRELKGAGVEVLPAPPPDAEVLKQHAWVQVLSEGTWQDLDTSFRDARQGQAFARPVGEPLDAASLPPDWYHTLRVRVLVTRPGGGEPESVLDHELRIDGIILHPITLVFAPQGGKDPYQATEYQPVLTVLAEPVPGKVFDLGLPPVGGEPDEHFVGAFGGEDIAGENALVSMMMELTLDGPGSPPRLITRQIVEPPTTQDVALRAAEVRDQIVSLYQIASGVGPIPYSWLARQQMKLVEQFAGEGTQEKTLVPVDLMSLVSVVASGEFQSAPARRFYAQPLLVAQRTRFGSDSGGSRRFIQTFDILHNRMEFIDADPVAAIRQGVFETELERAAFQTAEVSNTSTVFERATSGVMVIRPREPGKMNDRDYSEDAKLHIFGDLQAGYVVIVPNENVMIGGKAAIGWWRVHPAGGETLGRMHSGEGQGMTEKIISLIPSIFSGGANYYCTQAGRSDGWCNPCLIFGAGIVGGVIGAYGLVTSSHTALFSAARFVFTTGTAVYGGVTKSLKCVDWLTGGLL